MMSARWLRCAAVLVAVVVLAAACGGEPESAAEASGVAPEAAGAAEPSGVSPEPGSDGAAELSVPSVGSGSVVGGRSLSGLDLERLAAAVATLHPAAVCPAVVAPASFDDVVEVGRIAGGVRDYRVCRVGGGAAWGGARRVGGGSDCVRGEPAGGGFGAGARGAAFGCGVVGAVASRADGC